MRRILKRLGRPFAAHQSGQCAGQGMAGVDFQYSLLAGYRLLMLTQQSLEMHIHIALVSDQTNRALGEA